MNSRKMMKVAKHSLAIWLKPNDPESLKEQLHMCSQSWNCLPQRVLKSWVKTLSRNPEHYEFTGLAFKQKLLTEHFSPEEIERNQKYFTNSDSTEREYLVSNIVINRWVYKMEPDEAFLKGWENYFGRSWNEKIPGYNESLAESWPHWRA